ncbi:MAG: insulinase family protein [Clostridia bacterium]|nr:insulinase family protein [Clostridia bacterium]
MQMEFKEGARFHGFTVMRARMLPELNATLIEMRFDKTGTELCWYQGGDANKLFSVTFKTLPEDDTGVFHILEHSVLGGSDKYPVREPFVELLKSSMNTFLNAMTFPDKTMYPVSSRNERDFLNLTEVYLDAVFAPAILRNPNIFYQEGWHVELTDRAQEPVYKGVVFNEMKGALASVDEAMEAAASRLLFPDSCYRFISGGDPEHIPELSYEQFLDTYRRFYHPSNARFWLDGDIPAEETFALIEGYLNRFERSDEAHWIAWQEPVKAAVVQKPYVIAENEEEADKTQIALVKLGCAWRDKLENLGISVLCDALTGGNDSPLKRVILDRELGQDAQMSLLDGLSQEAFLFWVRNTEADKLEDIRQAVRETARELVQNGIDRQELSACINRLAFRLKEPTEPQGLVRAINALNAWLYEGDPATYLTYDAEIAALRENLNTRWYEELLESLLLREDDLSTVVLTPSRTLGAEMRRQEAEKLQAQRANWNDSEVDRLLKLNADLLAWQQKPDSEEAIRTLPSLPLSAVGAEPEPIPTEQRETLGVPVWYHRASCSGITHLNLYFRLTEMAPEELPALSLLPDLLGELPAAGHTVSELQRRIKACTGSLDFDVEVYARRDRPERCTPYLVCSCSALDESLPEAFALIHDILLNTDFSDRGLIEEIILQTDDDIRESVVMRGNRYAAQRLAAADSAAGAAQEMLNGITLVRFVHRLAKDFDQEIGNVIAVWQKALAAAVCRANLTVGQTGAGRAELTELIQLFPQGKAQAKEAAYTFDAPRAEGFCVASQISYAAMGAPIRDIGMAYDGTAAVLSNILTLSYLWNSVRVQGGAYGVNGGISSYGRATATSFRDPDPAHSLAAYRGMADFVRAFVESGEELDRFIISTVGQTEPLHTPRAAGKTADARLLCGITDEQRRQERAKMLGMKKADLLSWVRALEYLGEKGRVCVIGNKDAIARCENERLKVEEL